MRRAADLALLVALASSAARAALPAPYAGPLFDAVAQWDMDWQTADELAARVRAAGVARIGLATRGHPDPRGEELAFAAMSRAGPLVVPASPKLFRGEIRRDAVDRLIASLRRYKYPFVAEAMYRHADKKLGEEHEDGERRPIDPLGPGSRYLLDRLAPLGVPLYVHWEFFKWDADYPAFGRMFSRYPRQIFVVPHMGFGSPAQMDRLLREHPNVYATISKRASRFEYFRDEATPQGDSLLDASGVLRPEWAALFRRYPRRLLFATDAHKPYMWNAYSQTVARYRSLLGQLPADVAERIAHANAEELYRLGAPASSAERAQVLRVGYFRGGRTSILFRADAGGDFARECLRVELISKTLASSRWMTVSHDAAGIPSDAKTYGKATGDELMDLLSRGGAEAAVVGETSFVKAVRDRRPVVAVAELGHDISGRPGHGIFVRKGARVGSADDLGRLVWGVRRSSGGDLLYLRSFLRSRGVDPDRATIVKDIPDDQVAASLRSGRIQAGYFHLTEIRRMLEAGIGTVYRPLDWEDAETSQSLLVTTPEILSRRRDAIERFVAAYMKRAAYENALPQEERRRRHAKHVLDMSTDVDGMDFPRYENAPVVRRELLERVDVLLRRELGLSGPADFEGHIDNSIVEESAARSAARRAGCR